jgi:hypothetical protein
MPLVLMPGAFAGKFFKVVSFGNQVCGHYFQALGQVPIIAVFCQAGANACLAPEIYPENHGTVPPRALGRAISWRSLR